MINKPFVSIFSLPYKHDSMWGYLLYFWSIGEREETTVDRMEDVGFATSARVIELFYEAMDLDLHLGCAENLQLSTKAYVLIANIGTCCGGDNGTDYVIAVYESFDDAVTAKEGEEKDAIPCLECGKALSLFIHHSRYISTINYKE